MTGKEKVMAPQDGTPVALNDPAALDLSPDNLALKRKQYMSYDECLIRAAEVVGPVTRRYLQSKANKPGGFKAGRRAGAPCPRLYPVDRESFEQWLYGKVDDNGKREKRKKAK